MTRFVLSGKNPGEDITEVVEEHFGIGAGKLITLLYFFAIYPILLVYSVAITNTVESFLTHQFSDQSTAACDSVPDSDCRHDDHRGVSASR
ncbi:serine transporter [Salmonella bongori]|nr:serine transporter [Salmonella bongori]